MNFQNLLIGAVGFLLSASVAFASNPDLAYSRIEGKAIDAATGKPAAGAHVFVWWTWTFGTHSSRSGCSLADATIADEQGRFTLSPPPERTWERNALSSHGLIGIPRIIVYRRGLSFDDTSHGKGEVTWNFNDGELREKRGLLSFAMKASEVTARVEARGVPASTDPHERVRELLLLSDPKTECESVMDRARVLRFYGAIAGEARDIAVTDYEQRIAAAIAQRAQSPIGRGANLPGMEDVYRHPSVATGPSDIDGRPPSDRTTLMGSALASDFGRVQDLLKAGANPNRTTFTGDGINYGYSALTHLIHAIGYADMNRSPEADRHVKMIALLLADPRTDPNWRKGTSSRTPLMFAASRAQVDVVALLLQAGADPNLEDGRSSALSLAEERAGSSSVPRSSNPSDTPGIRTVELLRRASQLSPREHAAALERAINHGSATEVEKLVRISPPPDPRRLPDRTPALYHATRHAILNPQELQHVEVVRLLAAYPGKDIPFQGKTPQQLAREAGRKDLIELLK